MSLMKLPVLFVNSQDERLGLDVPRETWVPCLVSVEGKNITLIRPIFPNEDKAPDRCEIVYVNGQMLTVQVPFEQIQEFIKTT